MMHDESAEKPLWSVSSYDDGNLRNILTKKSTHDAPHKLDLEKITNWLSSPSHRRSAAADDGVADSASRAVRCMNRGCQQRVRQSDGSRILGGEAGLVAEEMDFVACLTAWFRLGRWHFNTTPK